MKEFLHGLALSQRFYDDCIAPLMQSLYPGMPYAAALVGPGSDVQGFDTIISTDHDWGPKLYIFLENGCEYKCNEIRRGLEAQLPAQFLGCPVFYGTASDGVSVADDADAINDARHSLVQVQTPAKWIDALLGIKEFPPTTGQWLRMADQQLREATGGCIFRDDTGELSAIRTALAYYPDDVWYYRMLCIWSEISEENQFTGRTGDLNDDIGSRIIAARQATRMMRLAFLLERQYAPYAKWFGTAFNRLSLYGSMQNGLYHMLSANDWSERVKGQGIVLDILLDAHDALGIFDPIPRNPAPYRHQYLTRDVQPVMDALRKRLPAYLAALPPLGGLSDFVGVTPVQRGSDAKPLWDWLNIK